MAFILLLQPMMTLDMVLELAEVLDDLFTVKSSTKGRADHMIPWLNPEIFNILTEHNLYTNLGVKYRRDSVLLWQLQFCPNGLSGSSYHDCVIVGSSAKDDVDG